jgi:uncharacterized membrane protein
MTSPGITSEAARLRVKTLRTKTWICATVVVLSSVFGNFFMKRGLPASLDNPFEYIAALFRPQVSLGVALLILWMLSRMTLLSWADLSYVVPVTSIGYVLVALMGRIFLDERITARNWVGIALIVAGVSMVGRGTPQTARGKSPGAGAGL